MKFGLRCFTCGKGFDPTDTHAEIWCDGENVVTLCPDCTGASDLRIDLHKRGSSEPRFSGLAAEQDRAQHSHTPTDTGGDTFIWDALKRMQERADEFRRRGPGAA
jgi:hypothetical protein